MCARPSLGCLRADYWYAAALQAGDDSMPSNAGLQPSSWQLAAAVSSPGRPASLQSSDTMILWVPAHGPAAASEQEAKGAGLAAEHGIKFYVLETVGDEMETLRLEMEMEVSN